MAVMGVPPHEVPQDGPIADRCQGLGESLGVFAQPHAEAATEDDDLHGLGSRRAIGDR